MLEQEYESPLVDVAFSAILGSQDFIIEIKDKFLGKKKQDRNLPALRSLANRPDIEKISETVDSVIRSNNKLARQIKLHCCHKYSGKKLKEIGACFGIGESGVSQTSRRISEKLKTDKRLRRKLNLIEKNLKL